MKRRYLVVVSDARVDLVADAEGVRVAWLLVDKAGESFGSHAFPVSLRDPAG